VVTWGPARFYCLCCELGSRWGLKLWLFFFCACSMATCMAISYHKPHYTRHWGQQGGSKALRPWPMSMCHATVLLRRACSVVRVRVRTVFARCSLVVRSLFARCSPVVRPLFARCSGLFVRCSLVVRTVFVRCSLVVRPLFACFSRTPNTVREQRNAPVWVCFTWYVLRF